MKTYLAIGGLVAAGFDVTGNYLLTVTHSGCGVFSTTTWKRVARDYAVVYPEVGTSIGIGPVDGQTIPVTEMDFEKGAVRLTSSDGRIVLTCESSGIGVEAGDG
jgi:hypothetical protein